MILTTDVKLNLGLSVLRKRPDGYHDIETLFIHCREFSDTLEVIAGDDYSRTSASLFARYPEDETAQGISPDGKLMVTIAGDGGVDWDPLEDLCAKAYAILDKDFGLPPAKIFLEKKVPVGAGLGGGSADAACTLKALDGLFSLGLDDETLARYASRLGSDCAFFIYNRPMLGSGRGEVLQPFDLDLSAYNIEVIIPEGISVSTADAYRGITPRIPDKALREVLAQPLDTWRQDLVNDFEATVFARHPRLAEIKAGLYAKGAAYASMSGSGSALFALTRK